MSDWYQYHPGRATFKGVEICEYTCEGRAEEKIQVIAYASSLTIAQSICMYLNRTMASNKEVAVSKAEPLPGSF